MSMKSRRGMVAGVLFLLAVAGHAAASSAVTAADLEARYPGLHTVQHDGRMECFWGVPMNRAATPEQAASDWLASNQTAFGAGALELSLVRADDIEGGRLRVFTYAQSMDSVPVEFGTVKLVVLNQGDSHAVVHAAAKVASRPETGFGAVTLTGEQAQAVVTATAAYRAMRSFSELEMMVYVGEGDFAQWISPRLVWKFVGEQPGLGTPIKRSFFVDATTGELVHSRNEIYHIDVTGTVRALATPSPLGNAAADHSGNPPATRTVPGIRVRINGNDANSAFTDANGNFTIPWAGTTPVTVDCSVGDGRWTRVAEQLAGQSLMTASATATPGTPVTLNLNPAPTTQYTNAQVNAFIHQTTTHDFWKAYASGSTLLDAVLPANTSVTGTCNAFYDGASTNFYAVGGTCNNTAFSSVVAHEYGHHIVNRLGLAQGGFGEGFGDVMSILQYDDFVVGRFFSTSGGPVRTPDTAMVQYPCTSCAVHTGGQVLGGVVCKVRRNLGNKYGTQPGLERARQLGISWSLITLGGSSGDSALPRTVSEFLTINDDDGNVNNGTPDLCEISTAFLQHGIELDGFSSNVAFNYSPGTAAIMTPGARQPFTLSVDGLCKVPVAGTARIHWRTAASGAFTSAMLSSSTPNNYTGEIVAPDCAAGQIQYYFSVSATAPTGGPASTVVYPSTNGTTPAPIVALVSTGSSVSSDDFEAERGWVVGPTSAASGAWVRVDPNGTIAQPEDDHSESGTVCFVTGQGPVGGAAGVADVDTGSTILTSPAYNFAGASDVLVSYWRWYSNGAGAAPYEDAFRVDVSNDNGATWTNAETVGPTNGPSTNGGWVQATWSLSSKGKVPTGQVKIRFTAEDLVNGSLVEAAVDDVQFSVLTCVDAPPCPADYNQDGGVDGGDIESFFR
ncbi:MAG: hypothetical protein NTV94_07970, partial [Planctomycetota bacterium]|nr:hypothetical protein [Planctomycetota bacterium]